MQFKTNHSPGLFRINAEDEFENCIILDYEGYDFSELWSTGSDVVDAANMNLFKSDPTMLEYMMDRAKYISTKLSIYEILLNRHDAISRRLYLHEELDKILAILKDAGMEVVEK